MISRSLHEPGSDSSALMTRKLGRPGLRLLGHEAPLHAGREARAAAAAQARCLDHLDDRVLAERHQRLGVVPVAARLRRLQAPGLEAVEVGEDAVLVGEHARPSDPLVHGGEAPAIADQRRPTPIRRLERELQQPDEDATQADDDRRRWLIASSAVMRPLAPIIVILGRPFRGKRGRPALGTAGLAVDLRAGLRRLAAGQRVEDRGHALEGQVLVIVVVDLDHRRIGAGAEAFDLGQREQAVGGGVALLHAPWRCRRRARRPSRAACTASCRRPGRGSGRPARG